MCTQTQKHTIIHIHTLMPSLTNTYTHTHTHTFTLAKHGIKIDGKKFTEIKGLVKEYRT